MSPAGKRESSKGVHYYPAPLSTHDEVVENGVVFWDTLRRFHFMMNTRFMVPVIGGKELDLHLLYVEVTKRGGYEKVVEEKKWREVGAIFIFSPNPTSASYVLRKHYRCLLFSYEQVHFFKKQGPICSPPAATSPVGFSISNTSCSDKPELSLVKYSSQLPEPVKPVANCPIPVSEGTGIITGKFDCGYLVTVTLGSEVLKGVLYHPEEPVSSDASPEPINVGVPDKKASGRRRKRRRSRRRDDPNHPKPNRSGYNFFFAEKHSKFKELYPNREREFTKMIGESWSSLSAEERMVYQDIGVKDKERYKRELEEYKEKKKLRQTMEANRDTEFISSAKEHIL